ncbi:Hypothetical predicted protein [Lecanosticta acicola]|uniref:OPA3-like protein n=1 Tax=Lecanosticta acicola TaxID=111012 RepID=A0AAI9ECB4_9PEZI|nr:Hypothetical predicted protein [Lecanosticta acicola]
MSLTLKLVSLTIRTLAKPIGNYIKRQAKEHEGFRRFAVSSAQRVHRFDMRMRLGILHDPEAQQRMHEREQRAAEEKKRRAETPTVRSEAEQKAYDEQKAKASSEEGSEKKEDKPHKVKIRPLSESRAIELGANFFSEAFIFGVAVGVLLFENWRSRRKESARRDEVAERLEQLESEVESLRAKLDPDLETLHDLSERIKEAKQRRESGNWWNPLTWGPARTPEDTAIMEEGRDVGKSVTQDEEHVVPMRKSQALTEKEEAPHSVTDKPAEQSKQDDGKTQPEQKAEEKKPSDVKKEEKSPSDVLGLRGADLGGHDISLPLATQQDPGTGQEVQSRQLRFVLLSPLDVTDANVQATRERIRQLGISLDMQPAAVVFVLSCPRDSSFHSAKALALASDDEEQANTTAMLAYAKIQAELINIHGVSRISVLPLTKLEDLPELLKKHRTAVAGHTPLRMAQQPPSTTARELLQLCTADPPMREQVGHILSDIFPDLPTLAEACTILCSPPSSSSPSTRAAATQASSHYFQNTETDAELRSSQPWHYSPDPAVSNARARLRQLEDAVGFRQCEAVMEFWKTEHAPTHDS